MNNEKEINLNLLKMPNSLVGSPGTKHRLFIDTFTEEDKKKGLSSPTNIHWAYSMDIAISRAVLAISFGLPFPEGEELYKKFMDLCPDPKEGQITFTAQGRLKKIQIPKSGPWKIEFICHFIIGLAHRLYAFNYDYEKWTSSRFKAVQVGIPRGKNRTKTPHHGPFYKAYRGRLVLGDVIENCVPLIFDGCNWERLDNRNDRILLTTTDDTHWTHMDAIYSPRIWTHIEELAGILKTLKRKNDKHHFLQYSTGIIAQIHWWLAHAMPYRRGSAAITDMLTKTLLEYCGITTPYWKTGIAPDLEAFCTPLEEYIIRYNSFFSNYPALKNVPPN